ncbi:nucleotidyltransferase family protein [Pueribacillus theae]|nr:nucleotidyltransferase family protein [Pueribacillus theae]
MSISMKLKDNREEILRIAKENGIKNLKLFGSVARSEDGEESDIDLLVSFEEGKSLFDLIRFKQEMEEIMGKNVDVLTENAIHHSIKEKILNEAIPL